jgi:hypothetical protein
MDTKDSAPKMLTNDEVLEKLSAAVSRRDTEEALKYYHREMILDVPAFGKVYNGEKDMRIFLNRFFTVFPDYEILLDNSWAKDRHTLVLGKLCMTLTGEFEGHKANGERAIVPVFMDLTFRDQCTDYELFLFDIASICRVAGVPTEAFVRSMVS